jgi:hypothetical protein
MVTRRRVRHIQSMTYHMDGFKSQNRRNRSPTGISGGNEQHGAQ